MHTLETVLLISAAVTCLIALCFIPRARAERAVFLFLCTQFFSWVLGLVVVQFGWLEYPVHELSKANSTSFLFEFLLLPTISIYFVMFYPIDKPLRIRLLYFATVISAFTVVEVIIEKNTAVIDYHAWKWYWTWISMSLVIYTVRVIYKWFFRERKPFAL